MIKLSNVSFSVEGDQILSSLSLALEAQKTHVLLGSSGCGKSTLLKIILGLCFPTKGQVFLDGQLLTSKNQRQWVQKIGYCVQDGGLFPHLTAKDNILLVSKLRGQDPSSAQDRLFELCKLVQAREKILDLYPSQLSGGEKQRVSLMRALHNDPDILLMDEPLGALDPIKRRILQKELHDIFSTLKKTVVFVTHDIFEASYLSHNVILLSKGTILQVGSFNDLATAPANQFVSDFMQMQIQTHSI